jgi:hypothetical protein
METELAAPEPARLEENEPARTVPKYPKWFEGVTDKAGEPIAIYCGICRKPLTVLGCSVGPWTGFVIHPHRCQP